MSNNDKKKKSILSKLKNIKNKELLFAGFIIILILLIYFTTWIPKKDIKKNSASYDYCQNMQAKLEQLISSMNNVGKAQVMINWESSSEKIIAYITQNSSSSNSSTPQIIQGHNGGEPIVLKEIYPKVKGIAIICKGGDNVKTRLDIINLVSVFMNVSPDAIAVYCMK